MTTKLEGIAKKAQQKREFRFTSLAHYITKDLVWESLGHMNLNTTPGIDDMTVKEAKDTFQIWINPVIQSMHSRGYKPPAVKRCWIPKPGKQEKRPIGIPSVKDRALQRMFTLGMSGKCYNSLRIRILYL